jgi:hypothetical protein
VTDVLSFMSCFCTDIAKFVNISHDFAYSEIKNVSLFIVNMTAMKVHL